MNYKKKYSNKEYYFGPIFLEKKGPLFREYFLRELKAHEILLSLLPKRYRIRRYKLENEMKLIKNEIKD